MKNVGVDPNDPLNKCDPTNVTFFFTDTYFVTWDINFYAPDCIFLISLSSCPPNGSFCTITASNITSTHVKMSLDTCLSPDSGPGGVTINITYHNSDCKEGDSSCRSRLMYIPVVNKTS